MQEPFGQGVRFGAIVVLGVVLVGLTIWAGASPAEPMEQPGPDETDVTPNPSEYVGEQVTLGGFVVETEPIVIATRASGHGQFTLENGDSSLRTADGPLERGDHVSAFGTLEDESTLATERTVTRDSSEAGYMYAVSLLGGLWVVGQFVRDWRFDRETIAFVPREQPLSLTGIVASDSRRTSATSERRDHSNGGEKRG